uniref:Uncharacterized protein n=1 Tax=viral metagenome TaxID=1070528 RepID=A0A6C0DYJ7_9ZZZZ
MEDIINKIVDLDFIKDKSKDTVREYFNDDKILDIFKHKLIKCTITNTKKITGGKKNEDKINYEDKIKEYDNKLLISLYVYYENKNPLKIESKKIINYILNKYGFNTDLTTFYIGENIQYDESDIKIDYYNTYPKENITFDKIFITIKIIFKEIIKKINIIDNYVSFIISKYLKTNGCLIIKIHLLFDNSNFINFIKQLCRKFLCVKIAYPKKYMQISPIGYIILYNKSDNILFIDTDFNKIIQKYIKKFRKYILKSFELTNKMIQLNIIDNMAYEVLCNKIKYKIQY